MADMPARPKAGRRCEGCGRSGRSVGWVADVRQYLCNACWLATLPHKWRPRKT